MTDVSEIKIENFLNKEPQLSLSLYMPTHRTGSDVRQNAIRYKNLIGRMNSELTRRRIVDKKISELLDPLDQLLNDTFFWNHQSDGLALFRSKETFLKYRVSYSFPETVMVGNGFYLKPLIPLLSRNKKYYLLALNLSDLSLYRVTLDTISELNIKDLPKSLKDALKYNVFEKQVQFHTKAPGGKHGRQAMFHGQGAGGDNSERKKYILDFFHLVNHALNEGIVDKNIPLLLMGAEYLIPLYKKTNSYHNLVEKGLGRDPSGYSKEDLHEQSWQFMKAYFERLEEKYRQKFDKAVGADQAGFKIEEIVPAAYDGRVDVLFIQTDQAAWGLFNPQDHHTTLGDVESSQDESIDLIEFAVVHTLHADGQVIVLPGEKMPAAVKMAAIYRY